MYSCFFETPSNNERLWFFFLVFFILFIFYEDLRDLSICSAIVNHHKEKLFLYVPVLRSPSVKDSRMLFMAPM